MGRITNILVPVDGSEQSNKALEIAKDIAVKFNASITLLHVYELPVPITGYEYSSQILANVDEDLKKYAKDILDDSFSDICTPIISRIFFILSITNCSSTHFRRFFS